MLFEWSGRPVPERSFVRDRLIIRISLLATLAFRRRQAAEAPVWPAAGPPSQREASSANQTDRTHCARTGDHAGVVGTERPTSSNSDLRD